MYRWYAVCESAFEQDRLYGSDSLVSARAMAQYQWDRYRIYCPYILVENQHGCVIEILDSGVKKGSPK